MLNSFVDLKKAKNTEILPSNNCIYVIETFHINNNYDGKLAEIFILKLFVSQLTIF